MAGNNRLFAELDPEMTNKDGLKCTSSGVSFTTIDKTKVIRVEYFSCIIDGDVYKSGWEDVT